MTVPKKLYVRTYGCQMNVYDSERMMELLETKGYEATDRPEEADLVILNTCHIREKAAEKVYSDLGRLRPLRDAKPGLKIAVAGCVAQAEGAEIVTRQPMVDLVVGPQAYHRLPEMLDRVDAGETAVDTEMPSEDKFDHLPRLRGPSAQPSAFLTVQEGCDKFCAFCVVPYTRGAERSRSATRLLDEARRLAARGVREITLLGQNVNAYHGAAPEGRDGEGGTWSLARLIRALAEIDGLARIRYTTSHPSDMTDDLIAAHADCAKLMPYLHLPVQSGSDRILAAMNRHHTADDYLRIIDRLRAVRPDLALSGDFIVGFPGETEAEFEATMALVRRTRYAAAYSFRYSARPGTPAAEREAVPKEIAVQRLHRLQALIGDQQRAAQQATVGRKIDVLFAGPGRDPGQMTGKSEHLMAVHVIGPATLSGTIARVRIVASKTNSLEGVLI